MFPDKNLCVYIMCQWPKIYRGRSLLKGAIDKMYTDTGDSFSQCSTPESTPCLMLHSESTGMDALAADIMYHWCCYNLFTDSGVLKNWTPQQRKYAQLLSEVESLVLVCKKNWVHVYAMYFLLCWLIWASITSSLLKRSNGISRSSSEMQALNRS